MTDTVVIYPRGVRTEVPVDVCRCPILTVGDACPVHQQLPSDMLRHIHGTPAQDPARLCLLPHMTVEEITELARTLAWAVDPFATPADVTEAAAVVWRSPRSSPVQRSLATALAEATY